MKTLRKLIQKIAPWLLPIYHRAMAFLMAVRYGFPANKLVVVGVTGTKGKTSVSNFLWEIFAVAGCKSAVATTVNFRIGTEHQTNTSKQTMLGRGGLQKFLARAVAAGCTHAIIETSSEGILQSRHLFLNYRAAVFTNLSPEHIDRHGSFENYRATKLKLFESVASRDGGVIVVNADDESAEEFLRPSAAIKYAFGKKAPATVVTKYVPLEIRRLTPQGGDFKLGEREYHIPIPGEFSVYNAAAAATTAIALGIPEDAVALALAQLSGVSGRFQKIEAGQDFLVVVDYAHEPSSLKALYETVLLHKPHRIIGLLGAQGGGRDVWKRAEMGKIAARYCDEIVVSNEDPYDDDPKEIVERVAEGVLAAGFASEKLHKVMDRREAIATAIQLAQSGDAVVLSGKGGEVWMCLADGVKVPWNEAEEAKTAIMSRLEKGK